MRRRTLLCVSFAVALHGTAFLALDRFGFLAATHRPPLDCVSVIELVPVEPDRVAVPVALAVAVPPPQLAPLLAPKLHPELKSETKIEPGASLKTTRGAVFGEEAGWREGFKQVLTPQAKPSPELEPALQLSPSRSATEAMEVAVATSAPTSSASSMDPVNASDAAAVVDSFSVAKARPDTAPPPSPLAYLHNPAPTYPAVARLKRQEGVVLLTIEVSADGRASRVRVEKSSGFELLDEAALKAVRRWRFKPARIGGVPVAARGRVPLWFRLAG